MDINKIDYKLLKALDAVLTEQSFEGAAKRLFISQSAISQRLKNLEKLCGEPLLIRSLPLTTTRLGKLLLGHYQRVLQLEAELNTQLDNSTTQALPLAVNADSLADWFIDALTPLLQSRQLELNLYIQDESTTVQRMRDGEVLACVSSNKQAVNGAQSIFLGYMDYLCVATPAFIKRYFADGVSKESLQEAPAIVFDQYDDIHLAFLREHYQLDKGQYPYHTIRSSQAFVDLTLASGAYSFNSSFSVEQHIQSGALVNLLPEHRIRVPLYWHNWQLAGELMKALTEQVVQYAKGRLSQ